MVESMKKLNRFCDEIAKKRTMSARKLKIVGGD